jgi:putative alpha-1,2-mannosidase
LGKGKTLVDEAKRNSPNDQYIQSVQFNGKPYDKLWFRHADIVNGATIIFTLGSTPNPKFGAVPEAVPPSISV